MPVHSTCYHSHGRVNMIQLKGVLTSPCLGYLKKGKTAVKDELWDWRTEGGMEGRREGLPAKHSVTCWVCNWWGGKSTAFCLLPVSLDLFPQLSTPCSLGGLYVSQQGPNTWTSNCTDITYTPTDFGKMSPAYVSFGLQRTLVCTKKSQMVSAKFLYTKKI